MKIRATTLAGFSLVMAALPVLAVDVGDPLYSDGVSGNARISVVLENYERDVKLTSGTRTYAVRGTDATFPIPDQSQASNTDLYFARLNVFASEVLTLVLDAGALNASDSDSASGIFGGSAFVRLLQSENFSLSAVAAGHYVPEYDTSDSRIDVTFGREELEGTTEYYEAGGGLIASMAFPIAPTMALTPYAGVMASVVRGEQKQDITVLRDGSTARTEYDIEEDQAGIVLAGASLSVNDTCFVRLEGRFGAESSGSLGLGYAF